MYNQYITDLHYYFSDAKIINYIQFIYYIVRIEYSKLNYFVNTFIT